jgi:hypothetical protein
MGWKELPSWKKGGLIGGLVLIAILFAESGFRFFYTGILRSIIEYLINFAVGFAIGSLFSFKKFWFKGGLIGLGIGVIVFILGIFDLFFPATILIMLFLFLGFRDWIAYILTIVLFALIGAFIGWMVGKIRGK